MLAVLVLWALRILSRVSQYIFFCLNLTFEVLGLQDTPSFLKSKPLVFLRLWRKTYMENIKAQNRKKTYSQDLEILAYTSNEAH